MSSDCSASISTSTSSSVSKDRTRKVLSSGRGGPGNVVYLSGASDLKEEAEILQRRRIERELRVNTNVNTGRGGTGNIAAATVTQSIPFDKYLDPDDSYEQIVAQENKKAKKVSSTGRGGAGNLLGNKDKERKGSRRRPNSIATSLSTSDISERYSTVSLPSSPIATSPERSPTLLFSHNPNNSILSFVTPNPPASQPDESSTGKTLGDHSQKARWWKFYRRQRPSIQQKVEPQIQPTLNPALNVQDGVDGQPDQPQACRTEQPVIMNISSVNKTCTIGHFTPGGEQGQCVAAYVEDTEDEDDEMWKLEVLHEAAENEIDSFLDL